MRGPVHGAEVRQARTLNDYRATSSRWSFQDGILLRLVQASVWHVVRADQRATSPGKIEDHLRHTWPATSVMTSVTIVVSFKLGSTNVAQTRESSVGSHGHAR